jgi:hypothetical protein
MPSWLVEPWTIVLIALAGVILGCVVVIGLDGWRARRHGPRWRRRVAAGAVALLAVVGVYFAAKRHPMNNRPPMCYAPAIVPPPASQPSPGAHLRNSRSRLELLHRLGREGRLPPEVIDLRLTTLGEELASSVRPRIAAAGRGLPAAGEKEMP